MKKMVAQEQDVPSIAVHIKRILEEETGSSYVLKTRDELVHKNGTLWFLHLPLGASGWIEYAQQEGKSLELESVCFYDVDRVVENEYRSTLDIPGFRDDWGKLHQKDVRAKYARTVPKVVKFFDQVDRVLPEINRAHGTGLNLSNHGGSLTVEAKVDAEQVDHDERILKKNVDAMRDFLKRIADWRNEQRRKSAHMAQIRRTHKRLLESSE